MFGASAFGLTLTMVPFFSSLGPPANAGEDLPHIDVSGLDVGSYMFHDLNNAGGWRYSTRLLIARLGPDHYVTYYMNRNESGETMLPDIHWWRPGWPCKDFRPSSASGELTSDTILRCHDEYDKYRPELAWRISGEAVEHDFDDLEAIDFSIEGRYLVAWKG